MDEPIESAGRVIKAVEKIAFVDHAGRTDGDCEITFRLPLEQRDFLRLVRARLREDDVKVVIIAEQFQTALPLDDWLGSQQE